MEPTLTVQKLRALAVTGLNFSSTLPYHNEIYRQILELVINCSRAEQPEQWIRLTTEIGVVTPKVGSVVAVARGDGALLVLQRPTGYWCLPSGYADIGESPEETARREVLEETGIRLGHLDFLGISTTLQDPNIPFMWEAIFIGETEVEVVTLSHEHRAAEWLKIRDARAWHSTHLAHFERATKVIQDRKNCLVSNE